MSALRRTQVEMLRTQAQISTGHSLLNAGEDPVRAGRVMDLTRLLARLDQFTSNVTGAAGAYAVADGALAEAADLLREAHTLALGSMNSATSEAERASSVIMLDALIAQMQRLANTTVQGRYLFDGQSGRGAPFTAVGDTMLYTGGTDPLQVAAGPDWIQQTQLDGATVFGGQSAKLVGAALLPRATSATRLLDLGGAASGGVATGIIRVSDGINPPASINLSAAATLGDVVEIFNAAAMPGMTITLAANGRRLNVSTTTPGGTVTIQDIDSTMARDLGILAGGTGASVAGSDFRPMVAMTTPIAQLRGGAGLDASGIVITNGSTTKTLKFSPSGTVQDIINQINSAGAGVKAELSADGAGIELVNLLSGTNLTVTENGGTTATELGLRTFQSRTPLDWLNGGSGISPAGAGLADFQITARDGTTLTVSLAACKTVGDVVQAINMSVGNAGRVVASIFESDGILLTDNTASAGFAFAVTPLNQSTAAAQLGLAQESGDEYILGTDTSALRTDGVFDHLLRLRQAMAANNTAQIARQASNLEADQARMIELRGVVGVQARQADTQADRLDEQRLDVNVLLSQVRDVDLTEALVRLGQLESQLTASMLTISKMLDLSLLDFIRR